MENNQATKKFDFIDETTTVPISVEFENLNYSVKKNRSIFTQILNGISGQFLSGEVTAILGASGSGKTVLLNILSGYIKENVAGTIKMNGNACDVSLLRKLSAYIMQSDLLQPHLTPEEQMMIVAKLKLSNKLEENKIIVNEFIAFFNLEKCCKTLVEKLSGGERKRLSMAIELISNPPVIFLDEPISGLDSVSVDLCIAILKRFSSTGKTVICTIHQPSVPILNQFDQVYFLARGTCIYNGSAENILPFLTSLSLNCPITYSYSEFVIETVEKDPETVPLLSDAIENGKINFRKLHDPKRNLPKIENHDKKWHASFWTQFSVIIHRMVLQQWRNKPGLLIQLFSHIGLAVVCGIAFFGIGCNAKTLVSNAFYTWTCILFCMYSSFITNVLVFPFEMEILRREYLNQWYNFNAYYLALSIRSLPIKIVLTTVLVLVSYLLSDQPYELERFLRFTLTVILVSVVSDGFGLVIGCTFSIGSGIILAPCLICPFFVTALYGFGYGDSISVVVKMLMRLSYMRFAYIAGMYALMDDRPPLNCYEDFCYYKDPKHLIRDLGLANSSYGIEILGLLCYVLLFRVIAYLVLKHRMREELTGKNFDYVAQMLQIK